MHCKAHRVDCECRVSTPSRSMALRCRFPRHPDRRSCDAGIHARVASEGGLRIAGHRRREISGGMQSKLSGSARNSRESWQNERKKADSARNSRESWQEWQRRQRGGTPKYSPAAAVVTAEPGYARRRCRTQENVPACCEAVPHSRLHSKSDSQRISVRHSKCDPQGMSRRHSKRHLRRMSRRHSKCHPQRMSGRHSKSGPHTTGGPRQGHILWRRDQRFHSCSGIGSCSAGCFERHFPYCSAVRIFCRFLSCFV